MSSCWRLHRDEGGKVKKNRERGLSVISSPPMPDEPDETPILDYVNPRLIRRYQLGSLWKSFVRVIGGLMATLFLTGVIVNLFVIPFDVLLMIVGLAGAAALMMLIAWERGMVLREPLWEGMKDLRAATYRGSASRFDSSGVTIIDPNSPGPEK